jgi:uncharacterized surface anchored protein
VPDLEEGVYIVSETIAPDGYLMDNTPHMVKVKPGKLTSPFRLFKIVHINFL